MKIKIVHLAVCCISTISPCGFEKINKPLYERIEKYSKNRKGKSTDPRCNDWRSQKRKK